MSTDTPNSNDLTERQTEAIKWQQSLNEIRAQIGDWLSDHEWSDGEKLLVDGFDTALLDASCSLSDIIDAFDPDPYWMTEEFMNTEFGAQPDTRNSSLSLDETLVKAASMLSEHDYRTDEYVWLNKMCDHIQKARVCYINYMLAKRATETKEVE